MFEDRLELARACIRNAQYDRALELLASCEEWPSPFEEQGVLARAEVLTRRDPVLALEVLARYSDVFVTDVGRIGYYLASGKAYANSRNFESALEMFTSAQRIVESGHPECAARLAYQRMRLRWLTRDYDTDANDVRIAVTDADPSVRFEALIVRGWMFAGREMYQNQIDDLSAALELAAENPERCDAHAASRAMHALCRIGFELGNNQGVAVGARAYEAMDWTPDLGEDRFLTARALAWHAFLQGDSARAQWLLRDAKELAPTEAWKVTAHVDRAYVARMNRNESWAMDELLHAHGLAYKVSWGATTSEERQALISLAILFAPVDMAQAQRYVSTYIRLGMDSVDPTLAITNDRRNVGFEKYATGRVQQVLGNIASASRAFEVAYTIFSSSGHHFRAALAAEGLAQSSGDATWLERARTHAAHFPNSALYANLKESKSPVQCAYPEGLSQMRRQLALALGEGLDIAALSQRFSRSEFTMKREIQAVYDAFGVHGRSELR
ncbi:MAG: hypothetical protein ACYDGM_14270, partial [Vulcanimicrobiaceae bacterium]